MSDEHTMAESGVDVVDDGEMSVVEVVEIVEVVDVVELDDIVEDVELEEYIVEDALGTAEEVDAIDDADTVAEQRVGSRPERPGPTGDPRVDDAIARLDDLDDAPTSDHVTIVDDAHRRLQAALGDLAHDGSGRP